MTQSEASEISHETLVGLHVTDDEMYSRYRAGMTPILTTFGGFFRYDFRIGEVLKKEVGEDINRLFIISFPDREARDAFFSNEEYIEVRRRFFEPAVQAATIIAEYERTTTP